jgi:uncharacterized protein
MPHSFDSLPERGAWRLAGAHEGFEVARFRMERDGIVLTGTSVGIEDGVPRDFRYVIELDGSWRTRRAVVEAGDGLRVEIATDGASGWLVDGVGDPGLDGCVDLDLEGSVVTNTVPVHRLALSVAEHADAPAAYVRARTLTVERLDQTYARLADDGGVLVFDYASPRFGYRDRLRFAPDGLVLDYPNVGSRVRAPGSR